MRARLMALQASRARLVARAAAEREYVGTVLDRVDAASGWMDSAAKLAAEAGRYPLLLAAGAAFLVALWPRRTISWALRGWSLYVLYRRGAALWQRISPRLPRALP